MGDVGQGNPERGPVAAILKQERHAPRAVTGLHLRQNVWFERPLVRIERIDPIPVDNDAARANPNDHKRQNRAKNYKFSVLHAAGLWLELLLWVLTVTRCNVLLVVFTFRKIYH